MWSQVRGCEHRFKSKTHDPSLISHRTLWQSRDMTLKTDHSKSSNLRFVAAIIVIAAVIEIGPNNVNKRTLLFPILMIVFHLIKNRKGVQSRSRALRESKALTTASVRKRCTRTTNYRCLVSTPTTLKSNHT